MLFTLGPIATVNRKTWPTALIGTALRRDTDTLLTLPGSATGAVRSSVVPSPSVLGGVQSPQRCISDVRTAKWKCWKVTKLISSDVPASTGSRGWPDRGLFLLLVVVRMMLPSVCSASWPAPVGTVQPRVYQGPFRASKGIVSLWRCDRAGETGKGSSGFYQLCNFTDTSHSVVCVCVFDRSSAAKNGALPKQGGRTQKGTLGKGVR